MFPQIPKKKGNRSDKKRLILNTPPSDYTPVRGKQPFSRKPRFKFKTIYIQNLQVFCVYID
ncbi:hypothetical protein Hdeb2414_s0014g00422651 [Helianthus debilis subsp. tardiflorus]